MPAKGSNDLNMLLKAKVVKLRVELDYKNSNLHKQVDSISKHLEKKPVKLKVQLSATVTDLNAQIKKISETISSAKSFKPLRIGVEMDVKGSADKIKKQLKEVMDVVTDFNKKYGKQIEQMNKMNEKQGKLANPKGTNIKTDVPVTGFNNIKDYVKQLEQAEKIMRSKFSDGKGLFANTQIKDAKGNLTGFIATLERANGVVEKIKYSWNKDKNAFQVIDRQTATQTEKMVHRASQSLADLQREMGKTGKASKDLTREYKELERAGKNGTLTSDMVKAYGTKVQNAIREVQVQKQLNDLKREETKILREIANTTKGTKGNFKLETQALMNKARKAEDMNAMKDIRVELGRLSDKVVEYNQKQKETATVTKQRETAMKSLTKILRETHETEGALSRDNVRATIELARRAQTTTQMVEVQKKLNSMYKQQDAIKDRGAREKALDNLHKKMLDFAKITGTSGDTINRRFEQIKKNVKGNLGQIEGELSKWTKRINDTQRKIDTSIANTVAGSQVKNINNGKMKSLIASKDVQAIKEYLSLTQKLDIATAKINTNEKGITRITTTLASTGKVAKQVTYEVDALNGKLRLLGQQDVFNRNANLGIFEQMKVALARVPVWMGAMTAFYGTINGFKAMANEILLVDKALTDLRRVASDNINIDSVFKGAVDLSKELGNNIHDIMGAVNELSRTYGDFNERQLLAVAKTAVLMSNVSDLSAQEATESLVGTMNAFNIVAEDSIRIVDSLNEVDNDYAISTKQLATGLQKSASTARTFGVEMEENIGHITAIGSVTMESGNIIGNSLKTIYSRITTIGDAKDILESVDVGLYKIGETGQKEIKPVGDILSDLAEKWRFLSDEERQNVAVKVAGRYQLSRFLAMMNNWGTATKATATALSSQGSAMRENAKLMDSFQARTNKLKTAFTEMSLSVGEAFLSSSMLLVIEGLTDIAGAVVNVVDKFGALPMIFGILGMLAFKMGAFRGIMGSVRAMVSLMRAEFLLAAGGARTFGGAMAGTAGALRATQVMLPGIVAGLRAVRVALTGLLASTGIGLIFVGLGIAMEKLLGHLDKQKRLTEKVEKANKQLVDSYRNTEGGLRNLIDTQKKLQFKVDTGAIKEGTDEYNEYVKITNTLAEKMPTVVKYIDQQGLAHLKTSDAIEEQYTSAKKLSDLKNEETKANFEENLQKNLEGYKKETEAIEELEKKIKSLKKEQEKADASAKKRAKEKDKPQMAGNAYSGTGMIGGIDVPQTDNTKEIQKSQQQILDNETKKQEYLQKTMMVVQNTTMAYLESDQKLVNLTDAGKGLIENMVQTNEELLRYSGTGADKVENSMAEMEKRGKKLQELGYDLGDFMSEQYESMTKGVTDPYKIQEIETNMDNLVKTLPTTFFKLESLDNVDDLKAKFEGVLTIADQIKEGGSGSFDGMVGDLQEYGFTADEAKSYVANLALEYDNAAIRQQAMTQAQGEGQESMEAWVDTAIKAIDLTEQLFNINDDDVNAMKSHIQNLQQMTLLYGEGAKENESYQASMEALTLFTGLPESVISKDLTYYQNMLDLMGKVELQYDENTGALVGFNKEGLNDNQKKMLNEMIHLGKEHNATIDLMTGKIISLADGAELVYDKNGKLVEKVKEGTKEAVKSVDEYNKKIQEAKQEDLFKDDGSPNPVKKKVDETNTSIDKYKEKIILAKQQDLFKEDGTPNPVKKKVDDTNTSIDKYREKIELAKQKDLFGEDGKPNVVKKKVDDTKTSLDKYTEKIELAKQKDLFAEDGKPNVTKQKVDKTTESVGKYKDIVEQAKNQNLFNPDDTTPERTKTKVDAVGKSADDTKLKIQNMKKEKLFEEQAGDGAGTKKKIDELTIAIQKASSGTEILNTLNTMIGNTTTKATGLLGKITSLATGMGNLGMKIGGLNTAKVAIDSMATSLVTTQVKLGSIFTGLANGATRLASPINTARSAIGLIGASADVARSKIGNLGSSLSGLAGLTTGGLPEYVRQLGLLSGNLVLASTYGTATANAQSKVVSAFNNVVSVTKAYNSAISDAGSSMGTTYTKLASTIAIATDLIVRQYVRNVAQVTIMVRAVDKALKDMVADFDNATDKATSKVQNMSDDMHKEFKSGMDDIVALASGLPARIGKAIRDNMNQASGAMDDVAKDMVKRFKSELGIHSPSRVFESLGGWVIKGLANGLTGTDLKSLGQDVFGEFGGEAYSSIDSIKDYMQFGAGDVGIGASFGDYTKTSGFGMRIHPITKKAKMHAGQDYAGAPNSPIQAKAGGRVVASGASGNGFGNYVRVRNGEYEYIYAHLNKAIAPVGSTVKKGQLLGLMGSTGASTGTHLHYEVRKNGRPINPNGYAKGGFIDKEQVAKIGEHGRKEVIIPLEQYRDRAKGLWTKAGEYLGIDPNLISALRENMKGQRSKGGVGSPQIGGAFHAHSGDGGSGGESGGGDSGSSGVMQSSIYDGMRTVDAGYEFVSLATKTNPREGIADAFKYSGYERQQDGYEGQISLIEAKMNAMNKATVVYRDNLKKVVALQNSLVKSLATSLSITEKRQVTISKELKKLPSLSKQTTKQRETYNNLMQEYDGNIGKIASLKTEIQNMTNDIKNKSFEIFTDFIDEIVTQYDKAIDRIKDRIDNTEFTIDVMTLTNPDDKKGLLNAQISKATDLQKAQSTSKGKVTSLTSQYNSAVKSKGGNSKEAIKAWEELEKATEDYEDATLAVLQAEKEIEDIRGSIADEGIKVLKDYHSNVKDMALEAIDLEMEALEDAHKAKMEMYDKEVEKINSVYDEKLEAMDKEKDEASYQEELQDKNIQRAELQNKISLLSRDNSQEGRKKLAELQKELTTVNEEIADFQKERQDELLRTSMEEQKQAQLDAIALEKETAEKKKETALEGMDAQKETVQKQFDDLMNNDAYWAKMREDAIKDNFTTLTTELGKMKVNLDNMNKGIFDGLFKGFAGLSDAVKKQVADLNGLTVDNMIFNNAKPVSDVKEAVDANSYTMRDGKVQSNGTTVKTPNKTTPPPKPATPPKTTTKTPAKSTSGSSTKTEYYTIKKGDTFSEIEQRYKLPYGSLQKLNPNVKANALRIGQKIVLRKGSSSSTKAPSSGGSSTSGADRMTTSAVSLRKSAGYGNNIMQTLPKGAKVDYVGMEKGWAKIKYNGKTGFVGASYLKKFDTGGYTGDWSGKEGKIAMLHKKELVLNERQTSDILDTATIMDKMTDILPDVKRSSIANKMATAGSILNISYGDINVTVENGDKKKGNEIASEIMKGLKKRGG